MKLSDILVLTLFFVMGSMIFAIKQMQKRERPVETAASVQTPAPVMSNTQDGAPALRLQASTPEIAGSYGRLSLEAYLEPEITLRPTEPKAAVEHMPSPERPEG